MRDLPDDAITAFASYEKENCSATELVQLSMARETRTTSLGACSTAWPTRSWTRSSRSS